MKAAELYEKDFYLWTQRNAELLRSGKVREADLEHIAEEIEDLGKRDRRELESRLESLLMHLLKWQFQPDLRGTGWEASIRLQRKGLARLLKEMPSLRRFLGISLSKIYDEAVLKAVIETHLPEEDFPHECPYTIDQVFDEQFFPGRR